MVSRFTTPSFLFQQLKISVQQMLGCHEGCLLPVEHRLFLGRQHRFDGRVVIEAVAQVLVNGFIHPILGLFVPTIIEISVLLDEHKVLDV